MDFILQLGLGKKQRKLQTIQKDWLSPIIKTKSGLNLSPILPKSIKAYKKNKDLAKQIKYSLVGSLKSKHGSSSQTLSANTAAVKVLAEKTQL